MFHYDEGYGVRVPVLATPPPPPPVITQPAPHQAWYGIVRGVAARSTKLVVVRIDGRIVREFSVPETRKFTVDLDLAPGHRTLRVETVDVRGRRSSTTISPVLALPRAARPQLQSVKVDRVLQRAIRAAASQYGATCAIYVQDLRTGAGAAWNARATFPAASTLKVAIAITVLAREGGPPKKGSRLDRLLERALVVSDNVAANMLQVMAGGSTSGGSALVNDLGRDLGLESTEMYGGYIPNTLLAPERSLFASGIPLRVEEQPNWGVGKQTTAYDLALLTRAIWLASGGIGPLRAARPEFTPGDARYLLELLGRVREPGKLDRVAKARPGVRVLHKSGWVNAARHDAGLIVWKRGVALVTVMTYRATGPGPAADRFAGRVATIVYDHFARKKPGG